MAEKIIVDVKQGKLCGKKCKIYTGEEYFSFQGVPYAKPPLGDLRFKLPSKSNTPKPVMVWIHWGIFLYGSGSTKMFGPDFLVAEDVVLVTINYRFGLLGFINFEDPTLEIPGNAGLKDQVMALKWVMENISKFNGDPDNVTIFGDSAGAACVHYLMLSPMAKGLFHKAIIQSGSAIANWAFGKRTAPSIAKALKLETINEREIVNKLRTMTSEEILFLQEKIPDFLPNTTERIIAPVAETSTNEPAFIQKNALDLYKSGTYNDVPLIIGYCDREGMIVEIDEKFNRSKLNFQIDFESVLPYNLRGSDKSKKLAEQIKNLYFGNEQPSRENVDKTYLMKTDSMFLGSIHSTIKYLSSTSSMPIYFYRFALDTRLNIMKTVMKVTAAGASHSDLVGYLFTSIKTKIIDEGSAEANAVKKVTTLWTTFARNGNPNPTEKNSIINIEWKPVEKGLHHFLNIGENFTAGINPESTRMKLWEEIYDLIPSGNK